MPEIKINKIVRSKRRTLSLEINEKAELIARAPMKAPLRSVEDLIRKNTKWIIRQQERMIKKNKEVVSREFIRGDQFRYLGNIYPLFIIENDLGELLILDKNFIIARKNIVKAEKIFNSWYRERACRIFTERVAKYADKIGYKYREIKISNARKRWGSCSGRNTLSFSWRLIMAPLEIIDYVVAHELVHIKEKNHSRKFWDKVALIYPNYKKSRKWLCQNGHLLYL